MSVLALAGCKQGGGPPPVAPVAVETTLVATAPVLDRLSAVGTLEANEEVTLMPEVAGRLRAIHFTEGQRVEAGALLFELDDDKESALLAQAEADLDLARQNAQRAEALSGTRAISRQELDQVRSQVTLKQAVAAYQKTRLKELKLQAPFAGLLGARQASVGQFVNVGTPLVTLTDDSRMKVLYRVPERHVAQLKTGQSVSVAVAAYSDRTFSGNVDLVSPQVDESTRTVEVRALVANPDRLLKPGMFARVETTTGERAGALVIPERAVIPSLQGFAVYVVTNHLARLTPVELGQRQAGTVEIQRGLAVGQEIVTGGLQKILDGSPVQPAPAATTNAAAAAH